jgi:AraC-like DNA-binding protein
MDSLYGKDAVAQSNTLSVRSSIAESRKEWDKAIEYVSRALEIDPNHLPLRLAKVRILAGSENASLTWAETESYLAFADSMRTASFNAQLDELRTQYDVDRHVAEKERNRLYFLFALGGCMLLAVALGIWIYFSRKIAGKNRALTEQIRELTAQQEARDNELLGKTSFVAPEATTNSDSDILCPESRKDKLCREIRDFILLDKAYRNPNINRDYVIDHLGTNRELFVEAFMACFGVSFTEYINSLRLKDAVTLLEQSDLSIEDISIKTGFGTIRTFQRQFQSKFHITPKEFRSAAKRGK